MMIKIKLKPLIFIAAARSVLHAKMRFVPQHILWTKFWVLINSGKALRVLFFIFENFEPDPN